MIIIMRMILRMAYKAQMFRDDQAMHYAKNEKIAGLDGVVCSPIEAILKRKEL